MTLDTALLQPLVSRVRTDVHWRKSKGKAPYCFHKPLDEMHLWEHLNAHLAFGVCPIKAGESTTRVAVLDLDSHKGETSWEDMAIVAHQLTVLAKHTAGVQLVPFSSSGGKGIHLYAVWDEPQDCYSVRAFFRYVLGDFGYAEGAGGVSNNQIEIFPKQDSVPLDGFGNMFILPYSGESVPLEPMADYQRMPKDYPVQWPVSAPVPVVAKPEKVVSAEPKGMDNRLVGALAAINACCAYDDWLRVGQALHHETEGSPDGLSLWDQWSKCASNYPDFEELEAKWETFGRSSAQPVTAGTIYKMATEAGWIDTPSADDFEVLPAGSEPDPIPFTPRFNILPWAEFAVAKPFTWLIKQVMPKAALIVIYGPPGGGKSFWVLDAVNSIARGSQWRGKKVNQGGVLYICAEGAGGFRNRLTAYARHHKVDSTMPVYVLGDAPNLINKSDTPALLKAVEGLGPLSVIVVDTFAQVTPGSNENSSEGAGLALKNCRMLHEKTGATVVLVAHSGKDATKGVRGWSGIKGACDCEIEITRVEDSDIRVAAITKQKDGEDQEQKYPFKLVTIPVGQDEDGDPVTSCYVEHTDEVPTVTKEKKAKIGENERALLDAVESFFDENNEWPDVDLLLNNALELLPESKTRPAARKNNLSRSLKSLLDREILEESNGFVSLSNGNFSPVQH